MEFRACVATTFVSFNTYIVRIVYTAPLLLLCDFVDTPFDKYSGLFKYPFRQKDGVTPQCAQPRARVSSRGDIIAVINTSFACHYLTRRSHEDSGIYFDV